MVSTPYYRPNNSFGVLCRRGFVPAASKQPLAQNPSRNNRSVGFVSRRSLHFFSDTKPRNQGTKPENPTTDCFLGFCARQTTSGTKPIGTKPQVVCLHKTPLHRGCLPKRLFARRHKTQNDTKPRICCRVLGFCAQANNLLGTKPRICCPASLTRS